MNSEQSTPKFYCNKCLHPLRLFDESLASVSSTGRSSAPINSLTTCHHVLCNACRPHVARDSPAVCPACAQKCQLMEIGRKTMPLHKQLLFHPLAKALELMKMVIRFQEFQTSFSNDRLAKQRAHIRERVDQKKQDALALRQQWKSHKLAIARYKAIYQFYKEHKSARQAERDRDRRYQAAMEANRRRRSRDCPPQPYGFDRTPADYGQRQPVGDQYAYNRETPGVAAQFHQPQPERRRSRPNPDEHRFQLDPPPRRSSQHQRARDRRSSLYYEEPPTYSREPNERTHQVPPAPIGHRRIEVDIDPARLQQKPAANDMGPRRFSIELPGNMFYIERSEPPPRSSLASDTPASHRGAAHHQGAHHPRFDSPPF